MKNEKKFSLGDAVKNFHKTEPLKIDLASTVADKVFTGRKSTSFKWDRVLFVFAVLLIGGGLVYTFSFYQYLSLQTAFLVFVSIGIFICLSVKEYRTFYHKCMALVQRNAPLAAKP